MRKFVFFILLLTGCNKSEDFIDNNPNQDVPVNGVWKNLGVVPQAVKRYEAICFVINNYAYIGLGSNLHYDNVINPPVYEGGFKNDFWKYDISQNSWTQLADFPGAVRCGAVSFSLNNKGYVGLGYEMISGGKITKKDFWEYNPLTDSWTQLTDFQGVSREGAVSYSYNNIGYLGFGGSNYQYFNDFWKFDPNTNSWTQLSDFPGFPRTKSVGFVIDENLYAGLGRNYTDNYYDFWKYNISNNTWNQISSCISSNDSNGITNMSGFSIGNYGYLIGGDQYNLLSNYNKSTRLYNLNSDSWTIVDPGAIASHGSCKSMVSFSFNNRIFVGLGCREEIYPHSGRNYLGSSLYEYQY